MQSKSSYQHVSTGAGVVQPPKVAMCAMPWTCMACTPFASHPTTSRWPHPAAHGVGPYTRAPGRTPGAPAHPGDPAAVGTELTARPGPLRPRNPSIAQPPPPSPGPLPFAPLPPPALPGPSAAAAACPAAPLPPLSSLTGTISRLSPLPGPSRGGLCTGLAVPAPGCCWCWCWCAEEHRLPLLSVAVGPVRFEWRDSSGVGAPVGAAALPRVRAVASAWAGDGGTGATTSSGPPMGRGGSGGPGEETAATAR